MASQHPLARELCPSRAFLIEYEKAAVFKRASEALGEIVSFMSFTISETNINAFTELYIQTNPDLINDNLPYSPQFADWKQKIAGQSADAVAVILHAPDEATLDSVYESASRM